MSDSGTRISPWNSLVDGRLTFDLTTQDLVLDQLTKENARLRKELAEGGGGTKEEIEALEKEIQDLRNRNSSLIIQLTMSEQSNQSLTTENTRLSEENTGLSEENSVLKSYISDGGKEIIDAYNTALETIKTLQNDIVAKEETIVQYQADIESWKSITGYNDPGSLSTGITYVMNVIGQSISSQTVIAAFSTITSWANDINKAYSTSASDKVTGAKITDEVNNILATIGDSARDIDLVSLNDKVQTYVDAQASNNQELSDVYDILGTEHGIGYVKSLLQTYITIAATDSYESTATTFNAFQSDLSNICNAHSTLKDKVKTAKTRLGGTNDDIDARAYEVYEAFVNVAKDYGKTGPTTIYGYVDVMSTALSDGSSSASTVTDLQNKIVGYYRITHNSDETVSYNSGMNGEILNLLEVMLNTIRDIFVGRYNPSELPTIVSGAKDVLNYYFKNSTAPDGSQSEASVFLRTIKLCQDHYKDDKESAEEALQNEKDNHQADLNSIYEKCTGTEIENATKSSIENTIKNGTDGIVDKIATAVSNAYISDNLWTAAPPTTNLIDSGTAVTLMQSAYHSKVDGSSSSENELQTIINDIETIVGENNQSRLVDELKSIRTALNKIYNGEANTMDLKTIIDDNHIGGKMTSIGAKIDANTQLNLTAFFSDIEAYLGANNNGAETTSIAVTLKLFGELEQSTKTYGKNMAFDKLYLKLKEEVNDANTRFGYGSNGVIGIGDDLTTALKNINDLAAREEEELATTIKEGLAAIETRISDINSAKKTADDEKDKAEKAQKDTEDKYNMLAAITGNYDDAKQYITALYKIHDNSYEPSYPTDTTGTASYTLEGIKEQLVQDKNNLITLIKSANDLKTVIGDSTDGTGTSGLIGSGSTLNGLVDKIKKFYTETVEAPTLTTMISNIEISCSSINDTCGKESIELTQEALDTVKSDLAELLTEDEKQTKTTIPDRVTYINTTVGGEVSTILSTINTLTGSKETNINTAVTHIESTGDYASRLKNICGPTGDTDITSYLDTLEEQITGIIKATTGDENGNYKDDETIKDIADYLTTAATYCNDRTDYAYIYDGTNGGAYELEELLETGKNIDKYYPDTEKLSVLLSNITNTVTSLQEIIPVSDDPDEDISSLISRIKDKLGPNIDTDNLNQLIEDLNEKLNPDAETLQYTSIRSCVDHVGPGQSTDDLDKMNAMIGDDASYTTISSAISAAQNLVDTIAANVGSDSNLTSIESKAGGTGSGFTEQQWIDIYSILTGSEVWSQTCYYQVGSTTYSVAINIPANGVGHRSANALIRDLRAICKMYNILINLGSTNNTFMAVWTNLESKIRDTTGLARMMGTDGLKTEIRYDHATMSDLMTCSADIIGTQPLDVTRNKLYEAFYKDLPNPKTSAKDFTITELVEVEYGTYIDEALKSALITLTGDESITSVAEGVQKAFSLAKEILALIDGTNDGSAYPEISISMTSMISDLNTRLDNIWKSTGWTDNKNISTVETLIGNMQSIMSNSIYGNNTTNLQTSIDYVETLNAGSSLNDNLISLQRLYDHNDTYSFINDDETKEVTWPSSSENGSGWEAISETDPGAVSDLTKVVNQIVSDVGKIASALTSDARLSACTATVWTQRDLLATYLSDSAPEIKPVAVKRSNANIIDCVDSVRQDAVSLWNKIGAIESEDKTKDLSSLDAAAISLDTLISTITECVNPTSTTIVMISDTLSAVESNLNSLTSKGNIDENASEISIEWRDLKDIIGDGMVSTLKSSLNVMIKQIDGTTKDTITVDGVQTALNTAWTQYKSLANVTDDGYLYNSIESTPNDFYRLIQTSMTDESKVVNTLKTYIGYGPSDPMNSVDDLVRQLKNEINDLSDVILGYHYYGDDSDSSGYRSVYAGVSGLITIVGYTSSSDHDLTTLKSNFNKMISSTSTEANLNAISKTYQSEINAIYNGLHTTTTNRTMNDIKSEIDIIIQELQERININDTSKFATISDASTELAKDLGNIYNGSSSNTNDASTKSIKEAFDSINKAITYTTDSEYLSYANQLARYQSLVGTE